MTTEVRFLARIDEVPAVQWNGLVANANPFLSHEFLAALERHGCVGPHFGWWPRHLVLMEDGRLAAAAPLYVKDNSYGELVFDWSWADAYGRAGLRYYPKVVGAVPYTPATGNRLLLPNGARREALAETLINAALVHVREAGMSSLHWLFATAEEIERLSRHGLFRRTGYQFHWHNQDYRDFPDFLDTLASKKRKNINRERRLVSQAGVELELLHGQEVSESQWVSFHRFYQATFERKSGIPTLTLGFFQEIGESLGDRVVLVLARKGGRYVAGALMLRSDDTLYGRHWGSIEAHSGLHFEACYYQGLEYAIRNGLHRFEPGAQGEFKISRGFLPVPTYSSHWLAHAEFHRVIERYCSQEARLVGEYLAELGEHSPYRKGA
jgi:predicted N-acyltransferase